MPSMFIPFPRAQFEKFFQNKLFPDSAVSYHIVLIVHAILFSCFNYKEVCVSLLILPNPLL